jgi:hypothetical protein
MSRREPKFIGGCDEQRQRARDRDRPLERSLTNKGPDVIAFKRLEIWWGRQLVLARLLGSHGIARLQVAVPDDGALFRQGAFAEELAVNIEMYAVDRDDGDAFAVEIDAQDCLH